MGGNDFVTKFADQCRSTD